MVTSFFIIIDTYSCANLEDKRTFNFKKKIWRRKITK